MGDLHRAKVGVRQGRRPPSPGPGTATLTGPSGSVLTLGDHRMGRVVVEVMPKPEILDPQGKAVAGALARLGFSEFAGARQGKRFELEVEGDVTAEVLERARQAAGTLLANPVIEDVVRVEAVRA